MTQLNLTDTSALRTALMKRASQLHKEIHAALSRSSEERHLALADQVGDTASAAFADLIVDIGIAEVERDVEELKETQAALARLDQGHFGICVECEELIARQRLQANPAASRCLPCQQTYERTHELATPSL